MRLAIPAFAAVLFLCGSLTACAPPDVEVYPTPSPSNEASALGALGAPGCDPPSPLLGVETQGTPDEQVTSAFNQFQGVDPTRLRADSTTIKLAVRLDGVEDLKAMLRSPAGDERALDWGPEVHLSSNYARPGEEWGTGFSFATPGCWELVLERDKGSASFWFEVAPLK